MATLGISVQLNRFAATQYTDHNFNSLTTFNGKLVGVGDDGIFTLEGQTDNGTNIDAFVELPITDLGSAFLKRLRKLLVGYEADGVLKATVTYDEQDAKSQNYLLPEKTRGQVAHSSGVTIQRSNGSGRYFQVAIANTNGCDFSIDDLEAEIYFLPRRVRDR